MSQLRSGAEWLRDLWNAAGGWGRVGIVVALVSLWPFVAIYGAICLSFEIVESLDRSARFSQRAHWAVATFIVFGAVMAEYAKYH